MSEQPTEAERKAAEAAGKSVQHFRELGEVRTHADFEAARGREKQRQERRKPETDD